MLKAKVTIQDSCNAKIEIGKMLEADQKSKVVGSIVGVAYDFVNRKAPDGDQVFTGFQGQFEVIPADTSKESVESGVLFLPDAFHSIIAEALDSVINVPVLDDNGKPKLKDGEPVYQRRKGSVAFAGEIVLEVAKNPNGYSWGLKLIKDETAIDPLAAMKAKLAAAKTAALAAPPKGKAKDDKAA